MKIKKLDGLTNFFNDNFIEFNDPQHPVSPDSKLTALRKGLMDYYETYSIWTHGFYEYFHKEQSKIVLSEVKGHDYLIRYFSSITFIHLSFSQFLFEILENKSPIFAKLKLDNQFDLIKIFTGGINSIDVSKSNYVDYSIALSRVEQLIQNNSNLPTNLQLDTKYHFLLNHIKTLKQLSILRNDIIHSGKQMLNRYVYECFFVNQLLPLIREYINTQIPSLYLERNLYCKKNVINEISKLKLPEKFDDLVGYDELCKNLRRINHFKELGRASFFNPIHMMEEVTSEEHKKTLEENINKKIRDKANLHVHFRQEILGHYEVHTCPCCGTKSLTTFDYWTVLINHKTRVETAECSVCTYKVNVNIGEPKEFDIMNTELFTFLD